jgi:hypothetical protein
VCVADRQDHPVPGRAGRQRLLTGPAGLAAPGGAGRGSICGSEPGLFTVAGGPGDVGKVITRARAETGVTSPRCDGT